MVRLRGSYLAAGPPHNKRKATTTDFTDEQREALPP